MWVVSGSAYWFMRFTRGCDVERKLQCEWGPLETLSDFWPVNGVHPIGHRRKVHSNCTLNVRLPYNSVQTGENCTFTFTAPDTPSKNPKYGAQK